MRARLDESRAIRAGFALWERRVEWCIIGVLAKQG